jgi:hypothetical protein
VDINNQHIILKIGFWIKKPELLITGIVNVGGGWLGYAGQQSMHEEKNS